jgi:hypothetical protein
MRIQEIIRQVLDIIDQAEAQGAEQPVEDMGYSEADISTDSRGRSQPLWWKQYRCDW